MNAELVENSSVTILFEIHAITKRHALLNIEKFNYSNSSFYQRFKNITPVIFHGNLKWLQNFHIMITDGQSGNFRFSVAGVDSLQAEEIASILIRMIELIHGLKKQSVQVEFQKYCLMKVTEKKVI